MKKILFIICLVTFSFSYGSNKELTKVTEKHINLNPINSFEQKNFDVEFGLIPILKEELKTSTKFVYALDCVEIAMAVFDAAANQGHSAEDCGDMAMGTYWACATFKKLGENQ